MIFTNHIYYDLIHIFFLPASTLFFEQHTHSRYTEKKDHNTIY